ncbi:DinB family protein [Propionispora hippei]|uniref:DinB superfamily protein n=1 Tax=Propionispora hippei DSM 15287 TaxID=1123003 RepID=A0A1M6FR27_9FIRM|nr:DinB family protein [Propionispora hippei]SHJ00167.1 DinB superfamily protein [Propionispora hippei DSM 15287]
MKYFGDGLSELHKELNTIIRKQDKAEYAKRMFLDLHAALHLSTVSGKEKNEVDQLLCDLSPYEYRIMPTAKDETIAWVLWHIARIEDLTMGILVAAGEQLFNAEWKKQLNIPISDTGNALTDDEIMEFSKQINIDKLIAYRNTVGQRTRDIVKTLTSTDMKRRVTSPGLATIRQIGGVTDQKNSLWLLDFWSKKDVAGILLMPPTRHVMLHLNDCCNWKQQIRKRKTYFRSI